MRTDQNFITKVTSTGKGVKRGLEKTRRSPKRWARADEILGCSFDPSEFIRGNLLDMSILNVEEAYKDMPPEERPFICSMGISRNVPMVECAFGMVPQGSVLSYQYPKKTNGTTDASAAAPKRPRLPK